MIFNFLSIWRQWKTFLFLPYCFFIFMLMSPITPEIIMYILFSDKISDLLRLPKIQNLKDNEMNLRKYFSQNKHRVLLKEKHLWLNECCILLWNLSIYQELYCHLFCYIFHLWVRVKEQVAEWSQLSQYGSVQYSVSVKIGNFPVLHLTTSEDDNFWWNILGLDPDSIEI